MKLFISMNIKTRGELTTEQVVLVDYHLIQIAKLECNLGVDSTEDDRKIAKRRQNNHLEAIRTIDESFYQAIKPTTDEEINTTTSSANIL